MGIIGSLIIHSVFLFLSSYIHLGQVPQQEERIIEVSLVSIPPASQKKEMVFIPKKVKVKGPVMPSLRNESPSLRWKPKKSVVEVKDEIPPLRWQPKMVIPKEAGGKKEEEKAFQGPKLDIANTYGEIQIGGGGEGKGKEGVGTGGEGSRPWTLEITGEVARRAIFYQEGFKLPEWFEKKGISLEGSFKFYVLPDGSVDRVTTLNSFGYRELDGLAMNSVLRWRFCPLKRGTYEEWGIAKMKIKLK